MVLDVWCGVECDDGHDHHVRRTHHAMDVADRVHGRMEPRQRREEPRGGRRKEVEERKAWMECRTCTSRRPRRRRRTIRASVRGQRCVTRPRPWNTWKKQQNGTKREEHGRKREPRTSRGRGYKHVVSKRKKKNNHEEGIRPAHVSLDERFRNTRGNCEEKARPARTAERKENDEASKDADESRNRRKIRASKRHEKHDEIHAHASKHVRRTCRNDVATHPRAVLSRNDVACRKTAQRDRGERRRNASADGNMGWRTTRTRKCAKRMRGLRS